MELQYLEVSIKAYKGDITEESADAIVNAANNALRGGGGVDGAIHAAGGPEILAECMQYDGCPTGEVRVTGAGKMLPKYIMHTVGPIYQGTQEDAKLLADCYRNSLSEAEKLNCHSIAFPSISTGVYGYPIAEASEIATTTVLQWVRERQEKTQYLKKIIFVLFSDNDLKIYQEKLARVTY